MGLGVGLARFADQARALGEALPRRRIALGRPPPMGMDEDRSQVGERGVEVRPLLPQAPLALPFGAQQGHGLPVPAQARQVDGDVVGEGQGSRGVGIEPGLLGAGAAQALALPGRAGLRVALVDGVVDHGEAEHRPAPLARHGVRQRDELGLGQRDRYAAEMVPRLHGQRDDAEAGQGRCGEASEPADHGPHRQRPRRGAARASPTAPTSSPAPAKASSGEE